MRERLARYASALLVSAVSSYCGLSRHALAETAESPACSLADVQAWQLALDEPTEEASPAYILRVSEAFIDRCPGRPEVSSAHRMAGLAAGWSGKPELASDHFSKARSIRDTEALFMAMAAAGHDGAAGKMRAYADRAFDAWLARIERRRAGTITTEPVPGGEVLSVVFKPTQGGTVTSRLWVARPDGDAWPAALSVQSDAQLTAFHRLVSGPEANSLTHVRLYRCRQRTLLGRSDKPVNNEDLEALARQSMTAYLAAPDYLEAGRFEVCLFAGHILPEPGIPGRVATQ